MSPPQLARRCCLGRRDVQFSSSLSGSIAMDRIGFHKAAYTRDLARLWRVALVDVHHQRNRPQSRPHWRESYSGNLLPSVRKITSAPRTELSRRQLVTTALALAASISIGER